MIIKKKDWLKNWGKKSIKFQKFVICPIAHIK